MRKSVWNSACAALLIVICGLGVVRAQPATSYTIISLDIGRPPGGTWRINNNTEVVGGSDWDGDMRPFLYSGGTFISLANLNLRPAGINDYGQIIGHTQFNREPVILDRGRRIFLGAAHSMFLASINNSGQVAGYHIPPCCSGGVSRGFIYANGVTSNLKEIAGMDGMQVFDISNEGHVVGFYSTDTAVFQKIHSFLYKDGEYVDLSVLGAYRASSVNDAGYVVGDWLGPEGSRAFLIANGPLHDIGTLPGGKFSFAFAINNRVQVVGASNIAGGARHAFLYENGVMYDLNDLLPANSGWVLTDAVDINDRGQIVGKGLKDGKEIGFLLSPQSELLPVLITEEGSENAIALDSVTSARGPFSVVNLHNFSSDQRTRVTLFARNVVVPQGGDNSGITARAEDELQRIIELPVESVSTAANFKWMTQVVVRLPDELEGAGAVRVSLTVNGVESNQGTIIIKPSDPQTN